MNSKELFIIAATLPDDADQIVITDRRGQIVYFSSNEPDTQGLFKVIPNKDYCAGVKSYD